MPFIFVYISKTFNMYTSYIMVIFNTTTNRKKLKPDILFNLTFKY